jgi:hypothetical protein
MRIFVFGTLLMLCFCFWNIRFWKRYFSGNALLDDGAKLVSDAMVASATSGMCVCVCARCY